MSWAAFIAWLLSLFGKKTITTKWSVVGSTVTGTVTGALIDTSRPMVDQNPSPRMWAVSVDRHSISTEVT
jgi:hypothetical protein